MKNFGFIKVGSAIPSVRVADVDYNVEQIKLLIDKAEQEDVEILVFPELCITGYTCQDLFRSEHLLDASDKALEDLVLYSRDKDVIFIVGAPLRINNVLMNVAVVIHQGRRIGTIAKTFLPNYNEFYEKRWFTSDDDVPNCFYDTRQDDDDDREPFYRKPAVFSTDGGVRFGIEICEDLWSPVPPSNDLAVNGADIIFNLSATDELIGKHQYLLSLIAQQSARTMSAYVYSSCGFGESTQDVVYGGNAIIYENGVQLAHSERFSLSPQLITAQIDVARLRNEKRSNTSFAHAQREITDFGAIWCKPLQKEHPFRLERSYDPHPFIPKSKDMKESCEEIFNIQVMGLAKRLRHTGCKNVVVGISGGLDSTLALLVCVKTFDKLGLPRTGIHGITMPGFGTTDRTHDNAVALMTSLGITQREISIAPAVTQHFEDIGHDATVHDVTYENSQARYRTMLLMNISNQVGGFVIGTGDLSELALGWATYNGDHMSMYGVNVSIPKTLIRHLVQYVADYEVGEDSRQTLLDIIDTPISPELIPADENGNIKQKTEDLVGPYELHDFFLYHFLRFGFSPKKIKLLAMRAFDGSNGPKYDEETVTKWLSTFIRRFFAQQFKRSCLPDGPKVGSVSLSPRGDWRMPSDASRAIWNID